MPDIAALGFAFDANNAHSEITKLVEALGNIDEKAQSAKSAFSELQKIFSPDGLPSGIRQTTKAFGKLNSALSQTKSFANKTVTALQKLPVELGKISTDHIKPIPNSVLEALTQYNNLVKDAAEAVTKLNDANKNIKKTPVADLGKAMQKAGRHAEDLGESITQMFRAGTLAAFFKQSAEMAVKFGEELAYINSLTLEFDIGRIRTGLLNLGGVLGSVTKNANGLYTAYSSGVRGTEEELVAFTGKMAELSTVIRADIVPTIYAATSAINAYGMSARDAGEITDLFYAIVKQGRANGQQLASGLGQVISTAATAGLSLDEMGASIASLTKVMQTRNAITYFNNMLSKMIKPTKETRLAAEKLGIELGIGALRAKGFAGVMQEIRDKTNGSHQALLSLFPDLRGQRAALQLLNKGWGDFQNQLQYFANKSGVADEAMKTLTDDVNFQLSRLPDAFNNIKIAIGDLITSTLTFGGALAPVIAAFNNMGEAGQTVVGTLAMIVGGYALVKTSSKLHSLLTLAEIKLHKIRSKQRDKETTEHSAVAASVSAETAAKRAALTTEAAQLRAYAASNAAIAQKIRAQAALQAENARLLAVNALQTEMYMKEALAHGDLVLAQQLELQFKQQSILASWADQKAVAAETHAIEAEAKARYLNAQAAAVEAKAVALSRGGVIRRAASSVVAPMAAGAVAAKAGMGTGLLAAIPGAGLLVAAIGALAPYMVAAGLAITQLGATISTTTLTTSLLGASLGGLSAAGAAAGAGVAATVVAVGSMVIGTAALGGALGYLAYQIPGVQKAVNALGEVIDEFFTGQIAAEKARQSILDQQLKNYERINQQRGTAEKAQLEAASAWQDAINSQLKGTDKLNMLYTKRAAAEKIIRDNSLGAIKAAEQELSDMRKQVLRQGATAEEVEKQKKLIDEKVKKLDQMKQAYVEGNKELINIRGEIQKEIENNQKLVETFKDDAFEYLVKAADGLPQKMKLFEDRAEELYKESGGKWVQNMAGKWNFKLPTGTNIDLADSFDKVRRAGDLEIKALQAEVKAKEKAAQAERRFNDNTLRLIQTMDKFKATTVTAVDANSREAQQLQSRAFIRMPQMQPATTAQNSLGQSQNDLRDLYQQLADVAKTFQARVEERNKKAEQSLQTLNARMDDFNKDGKTLVSKTGEMVTALDSINRKIGSFGTVSY